jgi:hypothetical protein
VREKETLEQGQVALNFVSHQFEQTRMLLLMFICFFRVLSLSIVKFN